MKLCRYGRKGVEKPGLIDPGGMLRDLSGYIEDITPRMVTPAALDRLKAIDALSLPMVSGRPRYGIPVNGIGNQGRSVIGSIRSF